MRAILLLLATAAASANHIIHPCFDASCAHWNDTKGERIESHSAGMLQSPTDKRWYWYGESKKTADLSDHGVNCYSAPDIAGPWTNEGSVLGQSQVKIPGKTGPFVIERPKVIYNAATKNFVMWFHLDDNGYKVRERPRAMCCSGGSCGLAINGITRGGSSKGWCGVPWLVSPLTHTSVHPPLLPRRPLAPSTFPVSPCRCCRLLLSQRPLHIHPCPSAGRDPVPRHEPLLGPRRRHRLFHSLLRQ